MRWLAVGMACLAVAACSKAPDRGGGPGDAVSQASGVAFTYAYSFRLPSDRIAAAQETQAAACERLGPARCRITGMSYRVDDGSAINASLSVSLAAPIARGFGREGVAAIETAGGALVAAEIGGTDTVPAARQAVADRAAAAADRAQATTALQRPGLPSRERAAQVERQAAADAQARAAATAAADVAASLAWTPMTFAYRSGSGVGVAARLADAWHDAAASFAWTLSAALTVIATLGPPALLVLVLFLAWRWWGRRWWGRMAGAGGPA